LAEEVTEDNKGRVEAMVNEINRVMNEKIDAAKAEGIEEARAEGRKGGEAAVLESFRKAFNLGDFV